MAARVTQPFACAHITALDAKRIGPGWWASVERMNSAAIDRAGEGFCPTCPTALVVCVEVYPGTDDPWPNMLPFGRCACCLGRFTVKNGVLSGWGVPVDDHGHEKPTWRPLHPPIRRTP